MPSRAADGDPPDPGRAGPSPSGLGRSTPTRLIVHLTPGGGLATTPLCGGTLAVRPSTQHRRAPILLTSELMLDPLSPVVSGRTPPEVIDVLADLGWRGPRVASTHATWIHGAGVEMEAAAILGDRDERVHVRLRRAGRCTLGAVHHEFRGRRVRHLVTDWDSARERVAADLVRAGVAVAAASAPLLPGRHRGIATDGCLRRLCAPPSALGASAGVGRPARDDDLRDSGAAPTERRW